VRWVSSIGLLAYCRYGSVAIAWLRHDIKLLKDLNPADFVNVSKIRVEINSFLKEKLEELDAETVKLVWQCKH
jgi:hypothetical protein